MSEEKKSLIVQKKNEVSLWNDEKWNQVKKMFVPNGVSESEAMMFLELSKTYELNPFKREIWCVPYGNKAQVFAGRDGFLAIAHRSGMFDGMETDFGYDNKGNLQFAECKVYNKSMSHPVSCKVFLKEYSTGKSLWASKPHVMLQKVAESSALRRAFNINGIYSPEEFGDYNDATINKTENVKETFSPTKEDNKSQEVKKEENPKQTTDDERERFDKAVRFVELSKSLDQIIAAKKRIDQIHWQDPTRKPFLDELIIAYFKKSIKELSMTDEVNQNVENLLKKFNWSEDNKMILKQIIAEKTENVFRDTFK